MESLVTVADEVLAEAKRIQIPHQATVIALHGDLGAGKTTFVQTSGHLLGVEENITSPTFVVMKKYDIDKTWRKFIHIDAYRVESIDELLVLNLEEELLKPENIFFIEWAERVGKILPANTIQLSFSLVGGQRFLKYHHDSE